MRLNEWKDKLKAGFGVDGLIVGLAGVMLVGSIFFLFEDGYLTGGTDKSNLTPVGRFTTSRNDVRRRVDSGLSWAPAKTSDVVYEGDSIFTGDESDAKLALDQGGELTIDPKSLVVVRTQGSRLEIDLQYGSLMGRVAQDTPIILNQGGVRQEITAKNAEVRIVKSEKAKETRIQVVKGEVRVRKTATGTAATALSKLKKEEVQVVRQDEVVALAPETKPVVKSIPVTLVAPASGKTLWLPLGQTVNFNWKSSDAAAPLLFEIARTTDFDSTLLRASVRGTGFQLSEDKRPEGAFYWRVRPEGDGSTTLPAVPSRLTVFADVPPLPVFPTDAQSFVFDEEAGETGKALDLTWEDKAGSIEFDVQLARDGEFQQVVLEKKLKALGERTPVLAAGVYHWRVKGHHPERVNPPWSRAMTFEVKPGLKAPRAPVLASTELNYEIPKKVLSRMPASIPASGRGVKPENITSFSWPSVENAASYEVEIATDQSFTNSIKQETSETTFSPQEVRPGSYFVRVRAKGVDGRVSAPSEAGQLDVTLPAPEIAAIASVNKKYPTPEEFESGKHDFQLKWSHLPFAESYELEWGSDPSFAKSKKFTVQEPTRTIAVSRPMDYAARVRALDAKGRAISPYSDVRVAKFSKELLPPPKPQVEEAPVETKVAGAPGGVTGLQKASIADGGMDASGKGSGTRGGKAAKEKVGGLASSLIKSPTLREPRPETSLVSLESSPTYVNFRWKPVSGASHYMIQVASDADFTKVISEVTVKKTNIVIQKPLPEGRVFWRVKTFKGKKFSDWSDISNINVIYQ